MAEEIKKHEHDWDCFKTSGGYTNALELTTPLKDRIETIYKTAYATGHKNGTRAADKRAQTRLAALEEVEKAASGLAKGHMEACTRRSGYERSGGNHGSCTCGILDLCAALDRASEASQ